MCPPLFQRLRRGDSRIESRIHLLADCFALSVHAYAVMSNHVHLVLYTDPAAARSWQDDEVIARWRRALPVRAKAAAGEAVATKPSAEETVSTEWIADKRSRLGSLSWFMKLLNEPIARRANAEDTCTGHFWEGRFRSQALLDEQAIAAAMAYVDLNPIRAGMATTLESSEFTSIAFRMRNRENATPQTGSSAADSQTRKLKPIAGLLAHTLLDISETHYFDLVAWSASIAQPGKTQLESPAAALQAIGSDEAEWQAQINAVRCGWRVVGGSVQMRALAERIGQHRFKRRTRRPGERPPRIAVI